jgi:hypothetical protein
MNATRAARPSPMRRFDPQRLGRLECDAWVTYYLRDWRRFLVAAISMVRVGFGMSWPRTVHGAWLVLRANQVWAPYPDNDPEHARRLMQRFYELVARTHDETFDAEQAARLEVAWWGVHRHGQRKDPDQPLDVLVDALATLYAHVYAEPFEAVRPAAAARAEAMKISDSWVAAGCDPHSPAIEAERTALVRSYALLLGAVHRLPEQRRGSTGVVSKADQGNTAPGVHVQ